MFRVARRVKADEGFSILHGSLGGTLSPLWDGEQEEFSASPTLQSSITFRKGLKGPPDVTMPLANTLFKVGRRSMLSASRWKWDEAVKDFKAIKGPVERSNVRVNVFSNLGTRVPLSNIPVVPLTPARKIVHGLGNIVRSVEFDDDVVGPASQELEASVTEYLKEKGRSGETVDVWALVVPKEAVSNPDLDPEKQLIQRAYQVRQMWRTNLAEEEVDYVGRWIEQGATFCRVRRYSSHPPYPWLTCSSERWWWLGRKARSSIFGSSTILQRDPRSTIRLFRRHVRRATSVSTGHDSAGGIIYPILRCPSGTSAYYCRHTARKRICSPSMANHGLWGRAKYDRRHYLGEQILKRC